MDSDGSQNISSEAFVPVTNADGHQTWPSNLGEPLPFISYQEIVPEMAVTWKKKTHPKEKKMASKITGWGDPCPTLSLGKAGLTVLLEAEQFLYCRAG